ncbi:MAG: formylglycine-generating enzyme family protein [Anaerolineae bacterium]|nr:formylglycine-generating enzyme family protein [Anaerolineae bacterium]MCO5206812.1 formylglycine-generating enzyme family protein [Anaerolineae bacterium]
MRLAPEHYDQLRDAMLDGFTPTTLAAALRGIGRSLTQLVPLTANYTEVVFFVIEQAASADWIDSLIAALKRSNPSNKRVIALPDHFPDAGFSDTALPRRSEPPPDSSDPIPSRQTPAQVDPVVPDDWPEPALDYDFISATRIRSRIDGKEMVLVPGGEFLFGKDKVKWYLPPFWMDKTPVTNAEYKRFLDANPIHKVPWDWDTSSRTYPKGKDIHPVVHVSWHNAVAYAEWVGKQLPTDHQWEKAARGTDGRIYPWGDEWVNGYCNTSEAGFGGTTPVGRFSPVGDSPYGCVDMAGNVWEWTATSVEGGYGLRGGSFDYLRNNARVALVGWFIPVTSDDVIGFRVCAPSF